MPDLHLIKQQSRTLAAFAKARAKGDEVGVCKRKYDGRFRVYDCTLRDFCGQFPQPYTRIMELSAKGKILHRAMLYLEGDFHAIYDVVIHHEEPMPPAP